MITCLGLSPALDVTYGVPVVDIGGIHRPEWKVELAGGKSLNVARALRLLDTPVRAILPLGGAVGEQLKLALEADGIVWDAVRAGAPTRRCVSVVASTDDSITEFYEQAPELDDETWNGLAAAVARVNSGWLAVSGSVPNGREDALAGALADAADRGVRLALDLRNPALDAVLRRTDPELVKVNRSEAEEAVGAGETHVLAERLRLRGAVTAIVTDGAAGSVAVGASGAWRASPISIGRYTVGAGDSFLAGFLAAARAESALADALAYAAAVAAANTLVPGAAVFNPESVDQLADRIDVEALVAS